MLGPEPICQFGVLLFLVLVGVPLLIVAAVIGSIGRRMQGRIVRRSSTLT